jgi:hydroxyacyl-ACP dehydratase HTD2-like protein with hotdog domain
VINAWPVEALSVTLDRKYPVPQAGGRIAFQAPLRMGDSVREQSTILKVEPKSGRNGLVVFVTLQHEFFAGDVLAISE